MEKLKAGVALKKINPEKGLVLGGYPHVERKNIGVNDSLYASVIIIQSDMTVVFVGLDLVGFSKIYSDRIRVEIQRNMQIERENIYIMCTHTHSSPYCMQTLEVKDSSEYLDEGLCRFCNKHSVICYTGS